MWCSIPNCPTSARPPLPGLMCAFVGERKSPLPSWKPFAGRSVRRCRPEKGGIRMMISKGKRWRVLGFASLLLLTALAAAWAIPVPYFVLRPGAAVPVLQFVDVEGADFRERGEFLLTTVSVREGNALEYLLAWMVPGSKLVPREEMLDPGENPDMYRRRQQEWMTLSQQ